MSCDHSTYRGDVIDVVRPASSVRELHGVGPAASLKRGPAAPIAEQVAAKAKRDAARSRSIPDSTQVDPEFVWGDEGPLND